MNYSGSLGKVSLGWLQPGQLDSPPQIWTASVSNSVTVASLTSPIFYRAGNVINTVDCASRAYPDSYVYRSGTFRNTVTVENLVTYIVRNISTIYTSNSVTTESLVGYNISLNIHETNQVNVYAKTDSEKILNPTESNLVTVTASATSAVNGAITLTPNNSVIVAALIHSIVAPAPGVRYQSITNYVYARATATSLNLHFYPTNSVSVASGVSLIRYGPIPVFVSNSISVQASASKLVRFNKSPANLVRISASTSSSREIYQGLHNNVSIASAGNTSNIKRNSAFNIVSVGSHATSGVHANEVSNTVIIGCYVIGNSFLPWRRHPLTRPPGGGIPHS